MSDDSITTNRLDFPDGIYERLDDINISLASIATALDNIAASLCQDRRETIADALYALARAVGEASK